MSATFSILPGSWSFGALANNSITDKTVTITNSGITDMTMGAMTGISAPYSLRTDLSGTYITNGGGTANFAIRYNPTAIGATNQTLVINNDSTNAPTYSFGVDGTSQQAIFSITPSAKVFTPSPRNTTLDQTVSVSNSGNIDMSCKTLTGLDLPFSLVNDTVSGALMPADTTNTFVVRYDATALGTYIDTLTVYTDDPSALATSFNVDGRCQEADISVSPTSKSFGIKTLGTSTSQVFRITNSGNINLTIGTVTGPTVPFWHAGTSWSDATIAPAGHLDSTYTYDPTALSTGSTSTITVPSNDPDTPSLTIVLDGTCQQAVIGVTPAYKSFGTKTELSTTDQTVTVTNAGNIAMVMGTLSGLAVPYSMVNDNVSSKTLYNNGDSSTVVVRYHPVAYGASSDTLVMPSNDTTTPSYSFNVSGTASAADITISPATWDFGVVPCNFIADVLITVTNIGDQTLTMASVTNFTGGVTCPFSIIKDYVSGATLGVNDSRTLTIRFLPLRKSIYTNSIVINSDDPDTPAYTLTVAGNSNKVMNHGETRRADLNGQIFDYID